MADEHHRTDGLGKSLEPFEQFSFRGGVELRHELDRAALAEKLLRSLEGISEAENELLWLAEAERRLLEIQSGQVETLPGEDVLRRAAAEIS